MRSSSALVLAVLLGAACAAVGPRADITERLAGTWAWEAQADACNAANTHTYEFSKDRRMMYLVYKEGAVVGDFEPKARNPYAILDVSSHRIRTRIPGETRLTDSGEPVEWDLVKTSRDSYCWRRADWSYYSCTGQIIRCS